jgi:hypothetical protein
MMKEPPFELPGLGFGISNGGPFVARLAALFIPFGG